MKYLVVISLSWSFFSWGKENPLLEMTTEPSAEQLQQWIDEGVNVNEKNSEGLTPLIISAKNKWRLVVQVLMDNKAHVNTPDNMGNTALHYTAYNNDLAAARIILTHQKLSHPRKPSIKEQMTEGFLKRFESNYVKINIYNKKHQTPFMIAVQENFLEYAQLLRSYKADIEARDSERNTPLLHAVKNKNLRMVSYLVREKANLKAKDKNNNMPIHQAVHLQLSSIVDVLAIEGRSPLNESSSEYLPPIHESVLALDARMIQILLSAGAHVNNTNTGEIDKIPPLGLLFILPDVPEDKMLEITQLFIDKNANINTIAHSPIEKNTFLHIAVNKNYEKLTDLLLKAKARLNAFNAEGRSPLLLAIEQNKPSMVQKLLLAGANPNQKPSNAFHFTPLHLAVYYHLAQITDSLVAAKASVKTKDLNGNTLLNKAFEQPFFSSHTSKNEDLISIVQTLLSAGVNSNIPDNDGITPAMKAVLRNSFQALEILAKNGADLTLKDQSERTVHDHLKRVKKRHPKWDTSNIENLLSNSKNLANCEKSFNDPA